MTPQELSRFKKVLETELTAATGTILRRRQSLAIEQSAESLEQLGYARERELAVLEVSRHSGLVNEIRQALVRIEDGTFGICQSCERQISPKRLAAVPWTSLCIRCQETADRQDLPGEPADRRRAA